MIIAAGAMAKTEKPAVKGFQDFGANEWSGYFQSFKTSEDNSKAFAYFRRFALKAKNHVDALSILDKALAKKLPTIVKRELQAMEAQIKDRMENPDDGDYEHPMFKEMSAPSKAGRTIDITRMHAALAKAAESTSVVQVS